MNTLHVLLTLASLGFAGVLLVFNRRMIREERRRSAARVEALREAAATEPDPTPMPAPVKPPEAAAPHPSAVAERFAVGAPPEVVVMTSHELFGEATGRPSGLRHLALPASLGVAIVSGSLAGLLLWNHGVPRASSVATVAAAPDDSASVPFELISLRHERTADGLSITGLVRNPASGRRTSDLNVVIFLFDRSGSFVTSARGPLDFRTLAPGDESPFTISLDKVGAVGRYRVSFRTDDKVVPHVDRRQAPVAVAAGFGVPAKLQERSRVVAATDIRR